MDYNYSNDFLKELVVTIDAFYNIYKKTEGCSFEEAEQIYEKISYILSQMQFENINGQHFGSKWSTECKSIEEVLRNMQSIKFALLFEQQEFCLIQRNSALSGMGSYIFTNLNSIVQCISKNKIPIIDMYNCTTPWRNIRGRKNGWEFFYEQPFGIGLEEVGDISGLPVCTVSSMEEAMLTDDFYYNAELQKFWHSAYAKYMRFTPEVKDYVEKEHRYYFEKIDITKVCGVLCRGTDYVGLKPYGHPVQPDCEEVIAKVKATMADYKLQYIFLATEDADIYERFCEAFGRERLLVTKTQMLSYDGKQYIGQVQKDLEMDHVRNNLDYLSALYQLSTLKYFIGGNTSGSMCVFYMSSGFEYSYVWNKGRYGIDDSLVLDKLSHILI